MIKRTKLNVSIDVYCKMSTNRMKTGTRSEMTLMNISTKGTLY